MYAHALCNEKCTVGPEGVVQSCWVVLNQILKKRTNISGRFPSFCHITSVYASNSKQSFSQITHGGPEMSLLFKEIPAQDIVTIIYTIVPLAVSYCTMMVVAAVAIMILWGWCDLELNGFLFYKSSMRSISGQETGAGEQLRVIVHGGSHFQDIYYLCHQGQNLFHY